MNFDSTSLIFYLCTVQIANEFPIFAGLVRDSCESNACEINAYSFANTRTFREVLHMNQSETRGPRRGQPSNHITDMTCDNLRMPTQGHFSQ